MQSLRIENHSKVAGSFAFPSIQRKGRYSTQSKLNVPREAEISVAALITENSDQVFFSRENLIFCYEAVIGTIDSCLQGRYSDFDAHTTTNCCHGMALLAKDLINSVRRLDLEKLKAEGVRIKLNLTVCPENPYVCSWKVSKPLIELAGLYLLAFIKETNTLTGGRTSAVRLKSISNISTNLCNKVAHSLKKRYANWVANRYQILLEELPREMNLTGAPVEVWGKYIQPQYLREDKYGLLYASSLFSMQVCIAHLIRSQARVALINDLVSRDGILKGRYVSIFQGDGKSELLPLDSAEINLLKLFHKDEPVVVIGGCVYSDDLDMKLLSSRMHSWLHQFPMLVLACEVFYPQFPRVEKDPNFDSDPIVPDELLLKQLFQRLSALEGVSASDPSLFCSTHIYAASVHQILELQANKGALPVSFIPEKLMKNASDSICAVY